MRLLSATPSPFARKARIALHEKGVPFDLVTEVPWNDDASAPRHNPLGKIPVLMLDGGECVYDSRFIVEYLERAYPKPPLVPKDEPGWLAAKRLEVLADGACDSVVLSFIEMQRPQGQRSEVWLARQGTKIRAAVEEIARRVDSTTPFAIGGEFTLGDIAVGCVLGYLDLRYPQFEWRHHRHLAALFDRLSLRPSFAQTVPVPQTLRDRVT